jgi:hypothetical protein
MAIEIYSRQRTYVGGVGGNVRQSTRGGNLNESILQLLGSDLLNSEGRVIGGLEGDVVGQQTGNVGGGHGGTRDGVDGVLAADPGRQDVQARSKDVSALSEVGEVSTLISESGGSDGDGLLSSGRGVVASISIVIASSDGEVDTSIDGGIDSKVQSAGATATQTHVGNATLEALLARLGLLDVSLGSPLDTLDDVGHSARAVRAEDLDGVDVGLLGNTVLLTGDSARAMSTVTISILISIALGDSLAPVGTTFKVNVRSVGTGIDDVRIDTLTTLLSVQVLVEATKGKAITVGDTCKTPGSVLLNGGTLKVVDLRVLLNVFDLRRKRRMSQYSSEARDHRAAGELKELLTSGCRRTCSITSSWKWPA